MPANLSSRELARLIPALDAHLPEILAEVRDQFRSGWPEYAEFLSEEQAEVTTAARAFLSWLVEMVGHPDDESSERAHHIPLFEDIGRIQWREGRDLTALLSAYQVGARVAWHHVSRAALAEEVDPAALAALAEAVFVFVDQLSSASARGYVLEQSEAVAERERRRDELVELLLSGRADLAAVRRAAARAGWPLPRVAAVILFDPDNPIGHGALSRLDSGCLLIRRPALLGAVVPDPSGPGGRQRLAQALRGAGAVVGHPVTPEHLPASVQIAETAAALQRAGILPDDPVFVDEHLDAILVHRDPQLLAALRQRTLAPLDGLPAAVRERLVETLTAWLRHFGDRRAMAAELHVHPQTVRYRMAQLHTLFGATLSSPDGRAQLILALAWSRAPAGSPTRVLAPAGPRATPTSPAPAGSAVPPGSAAAEPAGQAAVQPRRRPTNRNRRA